MKISKLTPAPGNRTRDHMIARPTLSTSRPRTPHICRLRKTYTVKSIQIIPQISSYDTVKLYNRSDSFSKRQNFRLVQTESLYRGLSSNVAKFFGFGGKYCGKGEMPVIDIFQQWFLKTLLSLNRCDSSFLVNPFPNKPWFLRVCSTSLLKTLWKKEKLLVTSNFSFPHSVF